MLKSILREPLVHFLLLGALLFAADAWLRPTAIGAANADIVVSQARIRSLAQNFTRTWQRPPTREELDGLIESHVREEVLYREALALGLDRDDTIIRRRLQQKVEFLAEEAAALVRPSDDDLRALLAANADAFQSPPRATFSQIYLDPRRRSTTLAADAKRLLAMLNGGKGPQDPATLGDRLTMLEHRYEGEPQSEVERLFGSGFAHELVKLPVGRWTGPIGSGYGMHLVKVDAVDADGAPDLEEVRPLLEREWANAKRQELGRAFYERLRAKYSIRIELQDGATP